MKLEYHDLSEDQFEHLVRAVCSYLFGLGVQGFSKGPDGGKDARFHGRAERFPSTAAPWDGRIVIQAKHTDLINKKFSEPGFSGESPNSVLSKEIQRIVRLRQAGELDYYLLCSNRRLAGVAEEKIRKRISAAAGVAEDAIYLCGSEKLDELLNSQPDIPRQAGINPFDSPPVIDPADLARVIRAIADNREQFATMENGGTPPPEHRTTLMEKNLINGLSNEYAQLIQSYIKEFDPIQAFLAAPENMTFVSLYEDTVADLQSLIIAHRTDKHSFDQILDRIQRLIFDRDYDLRQNKKLTRTVLFYMYWNCDIGMNHNNA
jgi:hypothetical protein